MLMSKNEKVGPAFRKLVYVLVESIYSNWCSSADPCHLEMTNAIYRKAFNIIMFYTQNLMKDKYSLMDINEYKNERRV